MSRWPAHRPPSRRLLLADEPTGNLDYTTGGEILELLSRSCVQLGQTIVLVTHEARAAAYADRVLVVRDGLILDEMHLGRREDHDPAPPWRGSPHSDSERHRARMRLSSVAWRSLTARPARTLLTVGGVALGVALVAGTLLAADAATRAVSRAAEELYGAADIRVRAFDDDGLSDASVTAVQVAVRGHRQRDTRRAPPHPVDPAGTGRAGLHPARRRRRAAGRGRARPADAGGREALSAEQPKGALVSAGWATDHALGIGDELC